MAETLRQVADCTVSLAHQTSLGFTVDMAARDRRGSSSAPCICIEVDGPQTIVRSLDPTATVNRNLDLTPRVRGAVALKRRVLRQAGHHVIVLDQDEWRN